MKAIRILGAVLAVGLAGFSALADDGNYQNFIVGERAQGMGGAVAASAGSLDACFFNPAGLGRTKDNTLSVSANLYGFQEYKADNGLSIGENMERNSFVGIPAAVAGISKLEKGAWALSAFIPDRRSFNEIVAYLDKGHFYNFSEDDQTIWVGPSYGYPYSDKLMLGASLFGVYRTYSRVENMLWGANSYSYSDDLKYDNLGVLAMVGAQYQLQPDWALGLVIQSPSLNVLGSGRFSATQIHPSYGSTGYYGEDLDTENTIPAKVTAGVAWQKPKDRGIALDVTYHFETDFDLVSGYLNGYGIPGANDFLHLERDAVIDINLGGEYYYQGQYPIRAGFFTSRSSAQDVDPARIATDFRQPQIDKYGITASVGRETKNMAANVGLIYLFGSGDAYGWKLDAEGNAVSSIVDADEQHLYVFLNTSFYF